MLPERTTLMLLMFAIGMGSVVWMLGLAGVALVLVMPFLIPYYFATHGGVVDYRGPGESQAFAAALADYIIPPTTHFLWGSAVGRLWRNGANGLWQSEWQLYLGAVALLLALAGLFHPRRRIVAALIAMALACLLFSFGPGLYVTHPAPLNPNTNDVALSHIVMPGRFLRELPGFNNLRGWARFGFLVQLSVGLLAAGGLTRVLDWMRERLHASSTLQTSVAGMAMAFVIFDFFPRPADTSIVAPRAVDQWARPALVRRAHGMGPADRVVVVGLRRAEVVDAGDHELGRLQGVGVGKDHRSGPAE